MLIYAQGFFIYAFEQSTCIPVHFHNTSLNDNSGIIIVITHYFNTKYAYLSNKIILSYRRQLKNKNR